MCARVQQLRPRHCSAVFSLTPLIAIGRSDYACVMSSFAFVETTELAHTRVVIVKLSNRAPSTSVGVVSLARFRSTLSRRVDSPMVDR